MIIYGASGHGKVVSSILEGKESFYFDDNEAITEFNGKQVFQYSEEHHHEEEVVIAIGNNTLRQHVANKVKHSFGQVVHHSVQVASNVLVGEGSQLIHASIVQTDSKIGKHCIINTAATVDHDCILEDFVHIAPNTTLCGNVKVGEGTLIGAGSVVLPGITIGKWCTIGAGSVVTKDVPNGAVVVGNPARMVK